MKLMMESAYDKSNRSKADRQLGSSRVREERNLLGNILLHVVWSSEWHDLSVRNPILHTVRVVHIIICNKDSLCMTKLDFNI